jgi:hypothetical protein
VVTNYHVLQSSLAKFGASPNAPLSSSVPNPAIGKRVALVTVQAVDGTQHTYDATLVGADRARGTAQQQPAAATPEQPAQLHLLPSTSVVAGWKDQDVGWLMHTDFACNPDVHDPFLLFLTLMVLLGLIESAKCRLRSALPALDN